MYGRLDQVGQRIKCGDCGRLNEVPPPPAPKKPNIPAALEGEQYELWDAEEQPLPSELVAHQPRYIAVSCRKCGTLMYATENRAGETIACPDCGMKHVVPKPTKVKPKKSVLASDAETPALDSTADPGARPYVPIPVKKMDYEERQEEEYARALEKSRRTGKPMEIDHRGRPIMPRWPLLTGVWRMLATQEVIARWILLSIVFGFAAQLLSEALLTPIQGQAEAIKLIFTVFGAVAAAAWFAMAGPLVAAMICDSASGENELRQPPQLIALDWFGELFSVVVPIAAAGLCGLGTWHLAQIASFGTVVSAVLVAAVVLVVLPMMLLSVLLEGSPLDVISMRLLRSFRFSAGQWILFYFQSFALAALVGSAAWLLAQRLGPLGGPSTAFVWTIAPLAIAALLVYARLLGRLGWVLTERMPAEDRDSIGS
jgi:DNA-directed RNA polymerase subunit M/transcription elongation factor TFIIS